MYMTDDEIRDSWNRAIDKRDHVQILADRNCIKASEMMQYLTELGVEGLDKRLYRNTRRVKTESEPIVTTKELAEQKELTEDEATAVVQMMEITIFDMIRNDTEIDNIEWLTTIIHAYEKLRARSGWES